MKLKLLCFHGSPGTFEDFSLLVPFFEEGQLAPAPDTPDRAGSDCVLVGYSWGAAEAILAAASMTSPPRALILISPYVFASPVFFLKRLVLRAPVLGVALLRRAGPEQMQKFATRSVAPSVPTESYRRYCQSLARPEILADAIFEKDGKNALIKKSLAEVARRRIPVFLVSGENDETSAESVQIAPLRDLLNIRGELRIRAAGHALTWTHPEQIARTMNSFLNTIGDEHE